MRADTSQGLRSGEQGCGNGGGGAGGGSASGTCPEAVTGPCFLRLVSAAVKPGPGIQMAGGCLGHLGRKELAG